MVADLGEDLGHADCQFFCVVKVEEFVGAVGVGFWAEDSSD